MKLFPFDPAKAQTITNPDGFPVYHLEGRRSLEVVVFQNGSMAVLFEGEKMAWGYSEETAKKFLCLGPKPGKTVYLNCWVEERTGRFYWGEYDSEGDAKTAAIYDAPGKKYHYIAIPVTGPEIEP